MINDRQAFVLSKSIKHFHTSIVIIPLLVCYLWKFHRKPVAPRGPPLFSKPVALKHTTGGSLLSMLTTQNTLINMNEVTN